jgi:excisionase family DNA binding protein
VEHWDVVLDQRPERGEPVTAQRFLQLTDVAEILNISSSQTYALVRSGELPAIKIGGRGQWRVERSALEEYIQRCYAETRAFVNAHPLRDEELAQADEVTRS